MLHISDSIPIAIKSDTRTLSDDLNLLNELFSGLNHRWVTRVVKTKQVRSVKYNSR